MRGQAKRQANGETRGSSRRQGSASRGHFSWLAAWLTAGGYAFDKALTRGEFSAVLSTFQTVLGRMHLQDPYFLESVILELERPPHYSFHAAAPNGSSFSSALASRHLG